MNNKKNYAPFEIIPVDIMLYSNILSGSVIPAQISTETIEVEEYSEAFETGFDLSF